MSNSVIQRTTAVLLGAEIVAAFFLVHSYGRHLLLSAAEILRGKPLLDSGVHEWYLKGGIYPLAVFILITGSVFLANSPGKLGDTFRAGSRFIYNAARAISPALFRALCTAAFAAFVLYFAWQCDDAYHSHVMSRNFAEGKGLVFNVGERVNASTAPLWTLLMGCVYFITREVFISANIISIALSASAFYLLQTICRRRRTMLFATLAAAVCVSFMTFCTSGLENPLLFFLWALLLKTFLNPNSTNHNSPTDWLKVFFISSLILLTRMDNALLLAPLLIFIFFRAVKERKIFSIIAGGFIGFLPFIAWEIFSVLYYGFPFPNTAYAKIGTGFPIIEYIERGVFYFADAILRDCIVLAVPLMLFVFTFLIKELRVVSIAAGIVLYFIYILYIGGDFMSGRHFTVPFFIALFTIVWIVENESLQNTLKTKLKNSLFAAPFTPKILFCGAMLFAIVVIDQSARFTAYAFQTCDYLKKSFSLKWKLKVWCEHELDAQSRRLLPNLFSQPPWKATTEIFSREINDMLPAQEKHLKGDIVPFISGVNKYYFGGDFYYNDFFALGDPLLARLPAQHRRWWFVGHMHRRAPLGYRESIQTGVNKIHDPTLHEYLDALWEITRSGKFFSRSRLEKIWKMNTGGYRHLLPTAPIPPDRAEPLAPWILPHEGWLIQHDIFQEKKNTAGKKNAEEHP